jgi:peptidylprolyl isomerase
MKLTGTLLLLASTALAQTPAPATAQHLGTALQPAAQTAAKPAANTAAKPGAATTHSALHPCDKLPVMSPKIPALPPGSPCPRPLYVISTIPSVTLDYVSPFENPALRDILKIPEASRFSLDYIDTKVGAGDFALPGKWYTVHYTGYLLDGTKFDSSFDHPNAAPFAFPYGQRKVITGWDTGLDGMHIGGKRRLFVPWELAYGPDGKPPTIPAKAELIFDIELLSQSDKDPTGTLPGVPVPPSSKSPPASTPPAAAAPKPAAPPPTPPPPAAPSAAPAASPSTPPKP